MCWKMKLAAIYTDEASEELELGLSQHLSNSPHASCGHDSFYTIVEASQMLPLNIA